MVNSSSQASSINSSPPVELSSPSTNPILNPQDLILRAAAVAAAANSMQQQSHHHHPHHQHHPIPHPSSATATNSNASSTSTSPKTPPQATLTFLQQRGIAVAAAAAATQQQQQQQKQQQHHQQLTNPAVNAQQLTSSLNSKSLPNIPTAVGRLSGLDGGPLHKRKSPPPTGACSRPPPPPHHGAMIVRRSKSSAILPLRKHLMEKTLQQQDKKVMDTEQFYFHQKQLAARDNPHAIRPIIEVMEEDPKQQQPQQPQQHHHHHHHHQPSSSTIATSSAASVPSETIVGASRVTEDMEVDEQQQHPQAAASFTARLGPSGLSPLVTSELENSISHEYVTTLLPRQPLDLAVKSAQQQQQQQQLQQSAAAAAAASAISQQACLPEMCELTGLGYDPAMLRHHCNCEKNSNHPENPGRLMAIWQRLLETGIAEKCVRVARHAALEEIQSCHSQTHALLYGTDMVNRCNLTGSQELNRDTRIGNFSSLECGGTGVDTDTYWNELETPAAVRTAVGTMVELSKKVNIMINAMASGARLRFFPTKLDLSLRWGKKPRRFALYYTCTVAN